MCMNSLLPELAKSSWSNAFHSSVENLKIPSRPSIVLEKCGKNHFLVIWNFLTEHPLFPRIEILWASPEKMMWWEMCLWEFWYEEMLRRKSEKYAGRISPKTKRKSSVRNSVRISWIIFIPPGNFQKNLAKSNICAQKNSAEKKCWEFLREVLRRVAIKTMFFF